MPSRTYATITIYTDSAAALDSVRKKIAVAPTSTSERNGLFGWHYSTKDQIDSLKTEDHLRILLNKFALLPEKLSALKEAEPQTCGSIRVRFWIFFEAKDENNMFFLSSELLHWLHEIKADICVDLWQ